MTVSAAPQVPALHLHPDDNVAVATRDLDAGTQLSAGPWTVTLSGRTRMGHKIALLPIPKGERVIRYGQTIGFATQEIAPGDWIHTHNLAAGSFQRDYAYSSEVPPDPPPITGRTFQGYRRADGRVGTRNYIAVISTVNCSAATSRFVAERFRREALRDYPNVDGVLALTHKGGCGLQYGGEDHQQLNRVLAGFAKHANVGAYVLIGLGCETAAMPYLVENSNLVQLDVAKKERKLPPIFSIQDSGGIAKAVDAASRAVADLLPQVNQARRESVPASEIILGLNCGGSDGNSGVTANPALGVASDLLVAAGGTTVLTETPEIYGAEHLLTRRARTREIGEKLISLIRWWEHYTGMYNVQLDNNPSPGNKEGGLTTIYEKSLGAAAKAGGTALNGVFRYAEPISARGFVYMDSPGFDAASVTGLVASGCNVVCFTTGRGSCYGCKPTPSIKIATNTPMYERMIDDMDINAGKILTGTPVEEVGQEIFDFILEVASGRKTKSEQQGIGEDEFAPWSIGPTL